LHATVSALAERAGLDATPDLYLHPGKIMNALTVGGRENAAIAVSGQLLQSLDQRESAAVLAHEISHIRDNDTQVMGFAAVIGQLTSMLSMFGQILLFLNLPLLLLGGYAISWTAILLLIFAPTASSLLLMALSRTREYNADSGAAELTGDPDSLASALIKIDQSQQSMFKQVFFPMNRWQSGFSVWRTHPSNSERVRRLMAMREKSNLIRRQLPEIPLVHSRPAALVTNWRLTPKFSGRLDQ
jgi:heat shock protein HtpX